MQPTPRHNPLREMFQRLQGDGKGVDLHTQLRADGRDPQKSPIRLKTGRSIISVPEARVAHISNAKAQVRSLLLESVYNKTFPESQLPPGKSEAMKSQARDRAEDLWKSTAKITADLGMPHVPITLRVVQHLVDKVADLQPVNANNLR